jgi:lipoate-protein ligase B
VARLETLLIQVCEAYRVDASTTKDTGVWVGDRKIAALGKVSNFKSRCSCSNFKA